MEPFLAGSFGNPSAIHQEGVLARQAVEAARAQVAESVQVRPEFVTFTGGGTEGNNLAIFGVVEALHHAGRDYSSMGIITTRIEHPSIGKAMERLKGLGVNVEYVRVDETGRIELEHLRELLSAETILVSCAYANSEIGVVQPLHSIRKVIKEVEEQHNSIIYFQVDAAQAPLWLSCQFESVGADFLVLDAAKCCGPKGVGVVVRSRRAEVSPTVFGGGQEQGLRPGTENVPGIVAAGVAFKEAQANWRGRAELARAVRDEGIKLLLENVPGAVLNGPTGEDRLANNINISVPGLDTEFTAVVLDSKGFAVSTKSACAGAGGGESVVVKEISADPARATSTLRFSLGPDTILKDIEKLSEFLAAHVNQMQKLTR